MLPSISSDLTRVRSTLTTVAAGDSLAPDARQALLAAERVLRLVERSWARMVPHLVEDNRRLRSLLAELARSPGVTGEDVAPASEDVLDPERLAETNEALRSALSRLISASASAEPAVRAVITRRAAAPLRAGLGSRPW